MACDPDGLPWVVFPLAEVPPALKSAPKESTFWARGQIESVDSAHLIELKGGPEVLTVEHP
jgi:hypothetical protein